MTKTGGSRRQDWATPDALFAHLNRRYRFTLDVCASSWSARCPHWFDEAADGLAEQWHGRVFCNPPFASIEPWVRKAWGEVQVGRVELACLLLPARTGSAWFHEIVLPHGDVTWIRGRLSYEPAPDREGKTSSPGEDSIIVTFERALEARAISWRRGRAA